MIARSCSLQDILFRVLHYQGHPPLWYVVLWVSTRLHLHYSCINLLAAIIASAGIYVFLRFSPFPIYLRALIPFGFFLGYQYAVVSRSYVLFPLLGFLSVHIFRQKANRPITLSLLLGLLANVSVHGTLVAVGFALAYVASLANPASRDPRSFPKRRKVYVALAVFTAALTISVYSVWPKEDLRPEFRMPAQHFLETAQSSATPISPVIAVWSVPPVVSSGTPALSRTLRPQILFSRVRTRIEKVLLYPFATSAWTALLYLSLFTGYVLWRRATWLLLPFTLLALFLSVVFAQTWHLGLLWVTMLMILWACWDCSTSSQGITLQRSVATFLALLCVLQLQWTFGAIRYGMTHSTFPAKETASYLKTLPRDGGWEYLGLGFTVIPFFEANPFISHDRRPFTHQEPSPADRLDEVLRAHPSIIVSEPSLESTPALIKAHYRQKRSFCGALYFPHRIPPPYCLAVFESEQLP